MEIYCRLPIKQRKLVTAFLNTLNNTFKYAIRAIFESDKAPANLPVAKGTDSYKSFACLPKS